MITKLIVKVASDEMEDCGCGVDVDTRQLNGIVVYCIVSDVCWFTSEQQLQCPLNEALQQQATEPTEQGATT